jgi:hypothetical protein
MKKPITTEYQGTRIGLKVTVDGKPLDPRPSQKLRNHSPDGFNWGYGGSGPAQLALGILLDYYGAACIELSYYQDFKWNVIARLPQNGEWVLTAPEIESAMGDVLKERGVGNA